LSFLDSFAFSAFSPLFHLFSLKFSLAPLWDVILVGIFHERKIIQAQKGTARDIPFLECERNNKDGLFSFQTQAVKINKLWPRPI
jgi:hypothetical protein